MIKTKLSMVKVKALQQRICKAQNEIFRLQSKCCHSRILHEEFPDHNAGWGTSDVCVDCGKGISCSTRGRMKTDEPFKKVRRLN